MHLPPVTSSPAPLAAPYGGEPGVPVGVMLLGVRVTAYAITLGITVSRHLIKSDELATADPAQIIELLRPCVLSLAARPDHSGPP